MSICLFKSAATEKNEVFLFFPIPTIAYTLCAVFLGHVLASWNPKILGANCIKPKTRRNIKRPFLRNQSMSVVALEENSTDDSVGVLLKGSIV